MARRNGVFLHGLLALVMLSLVLVVPAAAVEGVKFGSDDLVTTGGACGDFSIFTHTLSAKTTRAETLTRFRLITNVVPGLGVTLVSATAGGTTTFSNDQAGRTVVTTEWASLGLNGEVAHTLEISGIAAQGDIYGDGVSFRNSLGRLESGETRAQPHPLCDN